MAVEPDSSGSRAAIQPAATGRGGSNPSASMEHGLGKRLMTLLRAVYHMLRKGLCRKRLMMDLHLLLGRGKLAGKALRDLLAAAHHHHHHHHNHMVVPRPSSSSGSSSSRAPSSASSSSSSALPAAATTGLSFPYDPRDVEFSCTTTPSYSFGFARGGAAHPAGPARALFPFRIRRRFPRAGSGGAGAGCDGLDFAQVARALEKMHADDEAAAAAAGSGADQLALSSASPSPSVAGATPSPMLALSLGRSPAGARRLRVTDSPFPVDPPEGLDARADSTFDAFITKFYETLRLQQADATPDNHGRRRG